MRIFAAAGLGGCSARAGWLLVPLLLGFACALEAQEPQAGSRLRLETRDGVYTGIFVTRSADTLFLQHPATRVQFSVPIRGVLFAQESMGRPRTPSVIRGALQTGAAGALFGAILGLVMDGRRDAGPTLFGAGVGAAVGASVALTGPSRERWRPVEIPAAAP